MNLNPFNPILCYRGWLLLSGLSLVLAGCGRVPQDHSPEPGLLATVNGRPVTEASFRHWWTQRPPAADTPAEREALLTRLIERTALAQAAAAAGLDRDPVVLEQMESLLIARLRETRWQPRLQELTLSESELQAYYVTHRSSKFTDPERIHAAVLWFNTRGQDPLVARFAPRLESVRDQLVAHPEAPAAGEGFGALALQHSEHRPSRFKGGDVGWLEPGAANDPWRATVFKLAQALQNPGDLSPVLACEQGLFLVRLIDRQPEQVQPFDAVRGRIEDKLLTQRRQAQEEHFKQEIFDHSRTERFEERLAALQDLPLSESPKAVPGPPRFTSR